MKLYAGVPLLSTKQGMLGEILSRLLMRTMAGYHPASSSPRECGAYGEAEGYSRHVGTEDFHLCSSVSR